MFQKDVDYTKYGRNFQLKTKDYEFISVLDDKKEKGNPLSKMIDSCHHDYNTGGYFELQNIKWHGDYYLDYQIYIPSFDET